MVYNDGELELNIAVNEDTIWLTQKQIAELFENRTIQKYLIVQQEGKREIKRALEHYNLDVIISVGYRVNSIKATKFRQWATSVLKSYMTDGYVINSEKNTNQRFRELENDGEIKMISSIKTTFQRSII